MKKLFLLILSCYVITINAMQHENPTLEQVVDGIMEKANESQYFFSHIKTVDTEMIRELVYNFLDKKTTVLTEKKDTANMQTLKNYEGKVFPKFKFIEFLQLIGAQIFFRIYSYSWKKDSLPAVWLDHLVYNLLNPDPYKLVPDRVTPVEFQTIFAYFFDDEIASFFLKDQIELNNRQILLNNIIQKYAKMNPWKGDLEDFLSKISAILSEKTVKKTPVITQKTRRVETKISKTKKKKKKEEVVSKGDQPPTEAEGGQKKTIKKRKKVYEEEPSHLARAKAVIKQHPLIFGGITIGVSAILAFIVITKKYRAIWK